MNYVLYVCCISLLYVCCIFYVVFFFNVYFPLFETESKQVSLDANALLIQVDTEIESEECDP